MQERVAVVGLGYVGLPVLLAFARAFGTATGFDRDRDRVADLAAGRDRNGDVEPAELAATTARFSADAAALAGASFIVVAVPTPIDDHRRPDFGPLREACIAVGPHLSPGAVVVFESTVYPGATEEICGPLLEATSGLVRGRDFTLGYSPERINPGDREHGLAQIVKVVAGEDADTLERVARAYAAIVPAGIHRAPSIAVAEAAKVLENTQRDINIALMNELAMICNRLSIRTADVIAAARTKWNFLPFRPGLVGGHCVGVDPYWLAAKAEMAGHHPQMILAGRRINDGMGGYVGAEVARRLARDGRPLAGARVGILGVTFKADVTDTRNSRVPDIARELSDFGITVLLADPLADAARFAADTGLALMPADSLAGLDALVLAVPHRIYLEAGAASLAAMLRPGGLFVDVTSAFAAPQMPPGIAYWSL
ncbi:UDP-N-acetyl-D-galactosamine dehydrogenase [Tepidamorphus gemmatus]|uniref:UDP-N-acetyl-D-galactosamine dehydrogenase n=1 Tax=Tepidamorphus gemmatus TaxID=747076 RepID=A0A4R3M776_9HYPH|nr:nucleotide sugar dehydrogenase [Tepidamorphus gemmatus]TCT09311.1 UDP-N-acetyl-D-galactosamine dehydrogenase [Tepidamorphus gemmatus]